MKKIMFLFIILFLLPIIKGINVYNCMNLNSANTVYDLQVDLINQTGIPAFSTNVCFPITANNITLDCHNHLVDGTAGYGGSYPWGIAGESNNTVIRNCRLTDWWVAINPHGTSGIGLKEKWNIINCYSSSCQYGLYTGYSRFINVTNSVLMDNTVFFGSNNNTFVNYTTQRISIMGSWHNFSNSHIKEVIFYAGARGSQFTNSIFTSSGWCIGLEEDGGNGVNLFYNNLMNCSQYLVIVYSGYGHTVGTQLFNTTRQIGIRVYSSGIEIGGNYYTNSTGNGYSDTCIDSINSGFCDNPFNVGVGGVSGLALDYLPYSSHYTPPPLTGFYCGELGICTTDVLCFMASVPEFIMNMIICIQPIFILLFALVIASIIVLIMQKAMG